jgi:hypothetical protein
VRQGYLCREAAWDSTFSPQAVICVTCLLVDLITHFPGAPPLVPVPCSLLARSLHYQADTTTLNQSPNGARARRGVQPHLTASSFGCTIGDGLAAVARLLQPRPLLPQSCCMLLQSVAWRSCCPTCRCLCGLPRQQQLLLCCVSVKQQQHLPLQQQGPSLLLHRWVRLWCNQAGTRAQSVGWLGCGCRQQVSWWVADLTACVLCGSSANGRWVAGGAIASTCMATCVYSTAAVLL